MLTLGSFVLAAVLAEGALHPPRLRRPSDTAILAYNIAAASFASASHVTLRGSDGTLLTGWWLTPSRSSGRAVMLCHGVADSALGVLGDSRLFLRNGYSVLAPESRGHGESGGFSTYGVLEAEDTVGWLQWMKTRGARESFGFGESLGAAILLQSLSRGAEFKAIVAECAYASFEAIAEERIARTISGIGPFAPLIAKSLVSEAFLYTRLKYHVDLNAADTAAAGAKARIPILLIHGLEDHETSPANSQEIAARNRRFITLWLAPKAAHTGAYAAAPAEFEDKVLRCFSNASSRPGT